jgi:hypothetical protein
MDEMERAALKDALVASLESGATIKTALTATGVKRATFNRWLLDDSDFRDKCTAARESVILVAEDVIFSEIEAGNLQAAEFAVERLAAGRWKKASAIEHSGPEGQPQEIKIVFSDPPAPTDKK